MKAKLRAKYLQEAEYDLVFGNYPVEPCCPYLLIQRYGERQMVASVNLDIHPGEGNIFIKNWLENEGIFEALVKAGVLQDTGNRRVTCHVYAIVARILRRE